MNDQNRPPNFNPINAFDLSQRQVAIPIIPDLTQKEVESVITDFDTADKLYNSILSELKKADYPFRVHCIALPQTSSSLWLQGVAVQRMVDPNGIKQPSTEICLELSRTKDPMSGIIYIPYSSVIYLAARGIGILEVILGGSGINDFIVLVDKRLEHYAKKV